MRREGCAQAEEKSERIYTLFLLSLIIVNKFIWRRGKRPFYRDGAPTSRKVLDAFRYFLWPPSSAPGLPITDRKRYILYEEYMTQIVR